MKAKIEQLIEKYTELHKAEQMVESGEVLNDLQSLQDTTEEREVEIKRLEDSMGICPLCDEYQFPKQKYCSDCGAKIKRID